MSELVDTLNHLLAIELMTIHVYVWEVVVAMFLTIYLTATSRKR